MHVHLVVLLVNFLVVVELINHCLANRCVCSRTMVIVAATRQVLASPLRYDFIFATKTISWSTLINIFVSISSWVPHIATTYIVLRKPVFHPALISCTVMLLASCLIGWVVVDTAYLSILFIGARLREVLGTTLLLLWPLVILEVSCFTEFLLVVIVVVVCLDFNFTIFFRLFYSLLGIDCWETNVFNLWVESEQRNGPVTLLVIPFWSLVKLV